MSSGQDRAAEILQTAEVKHECACGASFRTSEEVTEHILRLYPPHAGTPSDGACHADITNWLPWTDSHPRDHRHPQVLLTHEPRRMARNLLQYQQYLHDQVVSLLRGLELELSMRADMLDFQQRVSDPRKYIRVAAAIEYRIGRGSLKPGNTLSMADCAREFRVSHSTALAGLEELKKRGIPA